MDLRRAAALLLTPAVLFSACSENEDSPARPQTSPQASLSPTSEPSATLAGHLDCPEQEEVLAGEPEGSLEGDVDGDGAPDEVGLYKDPEGTAECGAFLVFESDEARHSTPVAQEGMSTDLGFPVLRGLVELDGEPGSEIVVGLLAGASTEFFGVWTERDGELARIGIADPTGAGDLFPSGGSVGHVDASDCAGDGIIVISSAVPQGDGYRVTRTFYRFEEERAVRQSRERKQIAGADFDRFPEFIASPFGSC